MRNYENLDLLVDTLMLILLQKDFSRKLHPNLKYKLILDYFIASDDKEAKTYIRANFIDFVEHFIQTGDVDRIQNVMEHADFFTAENIDRFVMFAIDKAQEGGKLEIQLLLMDYQAQNFGFDAMEDIERRFAL